LFGLDHFFDLALVPFLKLGLEPLLGGRKDDPKAHGDSDEAIEVDAGPDGHGCGEREEYEGHDGKGEGELGNEDCEDVVIALLRAFGAAVRGEEERPEEAAAIWRSSVRVYRRIKRFTYS
jgi:hypothetical protein